MSKILIKEQLSEHIDFSRPLKDVIEYLQSIPKTYPKFQDFYLDKDYWGEIKPINLYGYRLEHDWEYEDRIKKEKEKKHI